jgi:hypothetical protein
VLRGLNERFPLAGWILTADALHANPGFFTLACEELQAHGVLTVKGNQPSCTPPCRHCAGPAPAGTRRGTAATAAARPAPTSSWTLPRR